MSQFLSVEEFVARFNELPEGGRWTELDAGKVVTLSPPTIEHGTAVLNLGKALADYTQRDPRGYACFELGLIVSREPPIVRFPAVSFFAGRPLFAESDNIATETRPVLVAEVASSPDRRRALESRIGAWLAWGVSLVWVLDPLAKAVQAFEPRGAARRYSTAESLAGGAALAGFALSVADLFKEPDWWRAAPPRAEAGPAPRPRADHSPRQTGR